MGFGTPTRHHLDLIHGSRESYMNVTIVIRDSTLLMVSHQGVSRKVFVVLFTFTKYLFLIKNTNIIFQILH